uniref:Uncharacterized protein n=1 Tax=Arundo donax TaxID=35708 RepID=A0A0A9AKD0_ARUDO
MCLVKEFEYIPIDKGVAFIFFSHHLTPHIKVLFKSMNDFAYKEIAYIFLNSENCSVIQWTLMELSSEFIMYLLFILKDSHT